ncbi:MAG: energy transducer TonB [Treponema sp.]|nr:energy transducer TonB [Treponema sp.]
MNEKRLRLIIFILTAALHFALIFSLVIDTKYKIQKPSEFARVMKLTDLVEYIPTPPVEHEPEQNIPMEDEVAEIITETDAPPVQEVTVSGALNISEFEDYLPNHMVSFSPHFEVNSILSDLVYPPLALRTGIEGRVLLELFVDRTGTVQNAVIIREEPPNRGFGESAVRTFLGRKGTPAYANGEPVACRYRYPLMFRINQE